MLWLQNAMNSGEACRVCLKSDGTRWRKGGEVKGKQANGVGSQYSHTTSERGVSSITNADAHTSAASSRLNWCPRRFKWTCPFRRKTKSGFNACAITFQEHPTTLHKFICYTDVITENLITLFHNLRKSEFILFWLHSWNTSAAKCKFSLVLLSCTIPDKQRYINKNQNYGFLGCDVLEHGT
jgi:hypothetical protein